MPILPGAKLGLLGGGQLGRLFTMVAQSMGYQVVVVDPSPESPAGRIADDFICADYSDEQALQTLSTKCAAITTEFENISADSLKLLAQTCEVSPDARCVSIAQNRILEKQFLADHGFQIAPFAVIDHADQLVNATFGDLLPGILKVSQFGYDGKGQIHVKTQDELVAAFDELGQVACVLERLMPLQYEISAVVARGADGELTSFPVAENQHVNGILDVSIVPARVSADLIQQAQVAAQSIAEQLNYQGVLCVEFFVLTDNQLLINEIAPRPHNSGHYSVDACVTSQFEQQVRTLCGLPLGDTSLHHTAVMVNLLGDVWEKWPNNAPDWSVVLDQSTTKLHLYGKTEARPGRKMGHFTVLGQAVDEVLPKALAIKRRINCN